jgi:hypothetical protein
MTASALGASPGVRLADMTVSIVATVPCLVRRDDCSIIIEMSTFILSEWMHLPRVVDSPILQERRFQYDHYVSDSPPLRSPRG